MRAVFQHLFPSKALNKTFVKNIFVTLICFDVGLVSTLGTIDLASYDLKAYHYAL